MNIYVWLLILSNIFWALIVYLMWEKIIDVRFQLRQWERTNARLIDYVNAHYLGARDANQAQAADAHQASTPSGAGLPDTNNGSRYPGVQSGT